MQSNWKPQTSCKNIRQSKKSPAINRLIKLIKLKLGFAACIKLKSKDEITKAIYLLKETKRLFRMYPLKNNSSEMATKINIPILSNNSIGQN